LRRYDTAEANTKPLLSIAAILSILIFFRPYQLFDRLSAEKAFSSLINVVISLNNIPFLG
jgi:hypothetical protein